ncbi:MAG: hypothetical protein EZS28_039918, partial [Streblomastix strix]
ISLSPSNSFSSTLTIPYIRDNAESLLIYGNTIWNSAFQNFPRANFDNGLNKDIELIGLYNSNIRKRSSSPIFEQGKIENINTDNYEDPRMLWKDSSIKEMRKPTKTTTELSRIRWGLRKNVFEDEKSQKIRIMLPTEKILKFDNKISSEPRLNFSIKNMKTELLEEVRSAEGIVVSDASPKGQGATIELKTGDTLVKHVEWKKEQKNGQAIRKKSRPFSQQESQIGQQTLSNGIGLHNYVVTNYTCYFESSDQYSEIWEDMRL